MTDQKDSGRLQGLMERFQSELDTDGEALHETLKEYEKEIAQEHKKDGQWHLVAGLARAACGTQERLGNLLFCLNNVKAVVKPQTAISGLLLRMKDGKKGSESDGLLPELIGSSLVTEKKGRKSGFSSRPLDFTFSLFDELRKGFKSLDRDFSRLGIEVWDAAPEGGRTSEWCEAWARFAEGLLSAFLKTMRKKDKSSLPGLANEYAQRLATADPQNAGSLIPFASFLYEKVAVPDEPERHLIQSSALGVAFRLQAALVSGDSGDSPTGSTEAGGKGPKAKSGQPAPAGALLPEGLPSALRKAIRDMSVDIEKYLKARAEKLTVALSRKDKFKAMVEMLERTIVSLEKDLSALKKDLESARVKFANQEKVREKLEGKLDRSREDFDLQGSMGQRELGQSKKQVLLALDKDLRTLCGNLQLMIREALKDPEKAGGIKNKWNQFDYVLWNTICGEEGKGFQIED